MVGAVDRNGGTLDVREQPALARIRPDALRTAVAATGIHHSGGRRPSSTGKRHLTPNHNSMTEHSPPHVHTMKRCKVASTRREFLALCALASALINPASYAASQTNSSLQPRGPVGADVCVAAGPGPVNPFNVVATTSNATNDYDIESTCGTAQTFFSGTGASKDVAYGVVTDQNCTVTVTADPMGTDIEANTQGAEWDLSLYVLNAPDALCSRLPALADSQCVTMDDNAGPGAPETVAFSAVAGAQYFVIVDGYGGDSAGSFSLSIAGSGCNLVPVGLQSFSVD